MLEITSINLDNEMDLPLTHKRAVYISKYFKLSLSTQTTFATAISEACRAVLEKTLDNMLTYTLHQEEDRWFLSGIIDTHSVFSSDSHELKYARRLIPVLEVSSKGQKSRIRLKLGLPRTLDINTDIVKQLSRQIQDMLSESPYEEIKRKHKELSFIAEEREEQLRIAKILNEKKSEFLSIASHELKTPLTVIKAYAQIGQTFRDKDPAKMADYLDKINQQAGKVNLLIQQLLDLAKIENDKVDFRLEKVEMRDFLNESLSSLMLTYPDHFIVLEPGDNAWAMLDKLRIEQALVNLVGNAAKYSSKGKKISISLVQNEDFLTVAVSDEGIGLSDENLAKVFDKFFRADEIAQKISGLGMGLYITTRIIKEHKGSVWAESAEGKGSTFYFSLPVIAA